MRTEEQLNQVLPTFPNDELIRFIAEDLKSGEHHIIITRMDKAALDIMSTLRHKYFSTDENMTDFGQMFFPFEEGITLANLMGRGRSAEEMAKNKWPMMVTRISKTRMSDEQIIAAFLPDPKQRARLLAERELLENGTLCFIHPNDAKAWRWVHDYVMLKMELNERNEN